MNQKDIEAFDAAWAKAVLELDGVNRDDFEDGWQAALEYARAQEPVAFVDANGDLIAKVKLEPWTDLYPTPPAQPVQPAEPAPEALLNGLTQQETEQTASCFGLLRKTAPLVRLTEEEVATIVREAAKGSALNRDGGTSQRIANAIMDKMIAKNGGKV